MSIHREGKSCSDPGSSACSQRPSCEDLFTTSKTDAEDGNPSTWRQPAEDEGENAAEVFREEDLDEILARADRELPADDAAEQEDGASSLMDAFKVGQCRSGVDSAWFQRLKLKYEDNCFQVLLFNLRRYFKVASFSTSEDDTTYWNRLIGDEVS